MIDEERSEVASIRELDRVIYSVGVYGMKLLIREADIRIYIKLHCSALQRDAIWEDILTLQEVCPSSIQCRARSSHILRIRIRGAHTEAVYIGHDSILSGCYHKWLDDLECDGQRHSVSKNLQYARRVSHRFSPIVLVKMKITKKRMRMVAWRI